MSAAVLPGKPALQGAAALAAATRELRLDWGAVRTTASGAALTVTAADTRTGWRYAHWLVSHASASGVEQVRYADLSWQAATGGWRKVDGPPVTSQVIATVSAV